MAGSRPGDDPCANARGEHRGAHEEGPVGGIDRDVAEGKQEDGDHGRGQEGAEGYGRGPEPAGGRHGDLSEVFGWVERVIIRVWPLTSLAPVAE